MNVFGAQRKRVDHLDRAIAIQLLERTDRVGRHIVGTNVQLLRVIVLYARLRHRQNQNGYDLMRHGRVEWRGRLALEFFRKVIALFACQAIGDLDDQVDRARPMNSEY
jgi:hypothetical protein